MPEPTPIIIRGLPADPAAALDLLVQGWTEPERSLQRGLLENALASGARDDFFCVRALVGDKLVGVALAQKLPGRTAAVWPPQVANQSPTDLATRLLIDLDEPLQSAGIRMAQALLALDQVAEEARFLTAGYTTAATLLYMACDGASFPVQPPALDLELEPVTPASESRLAALIESSYQGTLDCPLLNGLRTTDDVLAGYRAVGTHRPALWLLASRGQEDVGCLILADHPEVDHLELVYLGLTPAARGKGLGLALTRQAMWVARQLKRQRVVLAVDAANAPAIRLYEAAGFFGFDQRIVSIKSF